MIAPGIARSYTSPVLTGAGLIIAATLSSSANYTAAIAVGAVTIAANMLVQAGPSVQSDRFTGPELILLSWFLLTPLGSFYVRMPEQRSILTFNRLAFVTLITLSIAGWMRSKGKGNGSIRANGPASVTMTGAEIAWGIVVVVATFSVATRSNNIGFAGKIVLDSLALPLAAFYFARRRFNVDRGGGVLVCAAIIVSLFLFTVGAYELLTGVNLFPFTGSELIRAGERRVNGPFESDSSFAIISLMLAIFLRAAPRIFRLKLDAGARLACCVGLVCALAASVMPLFRGVIIGTALSWIVFEAAASGFFFKRTRRRDSDSSAGGFAVSLDWTRVGIAALLPVLLISAFIIASSVVPSLGRLAETDNVVSRLAVWEAGARMMRDRPVLGIGLWNFADAYDNTYSDEDLVLKSAFETKVGVGPHSNLVWIASELGIVGLIPYVAGNVWLLLMGYRALKQASSDQTRAAAACYLGLFAAYWIPGLTLVSGAYSDLNLYFFFLLGLMSVFNVRRSQGVGA